MAVSCSGSTGSASPADPAGTEASPTDRPVVQGEQLPTPTPFPEAEPTAQLQTYVDRGRTDTAAVALTFHTDGDAGLATELLDIMGQRGAPMTSFLIGSWLETNPDVGKRIRDDGHEVANHTYGHLNMVDWTAEQVAQEYERAAESMMAILGTSGLWARPGQTDVPSQAMIDGAVQAGYRSSIGFNNDPLDYKDPGVDAVVNATLDVVAAGDIISLHFGHPDTNAAMAPLLDGLASRNLAPVTISDLLGVV